jgi:hypothetical protein
MAVADYSRELFFMPLDSELRTHAKRLAQANPGPALGYVLDHGEGRPRSTGRVLPLQFRACHNDFPWLCPIGAHTGLIGSTTLVLVKE